MTWNCPHEGALIAKGFTIRRCRKCQKEFFAPEKREPEKAQVLSDTEIKARREIVETAVLEHFLN